MMDLKKKFIVAFSLVLAPTKSSEEFRREANQTKTERSFALHFGGWHAKTLSIVTSAQSIGLSACQVLSDRRPGIN